MEYIYYAYSISKGLTGSLWEKCSKRTLVKTQSNYIFLSYKKTDLFACTRQTKVTLITTVVEFLHALQKIRLETVSQQESPTSAGNKDDMCITN